MTKSPATPNNKSPGIRQWKSTGYISDSEPPSLRNDYHGTTPTEKKTKSTRRRKRKLDNGYVSDSEPSSSKKVIIPSTEETISQSRSGKQKQVYVKHASSHVEIPLKSLQLSHCFTQQSATSKTLSNPQTGYEDKVRHGDIRDDDMQSQLMEIEDSDSESESVEDLSDYSDYEDMSEDGITIVDQQRKSYRRRQNQQHLKMKAKNVGREKKSSNGKSKKDLMEEWVEFREAYLDEIMRAEHPFPNYAKCECCQQVLTKTGVAEEEIGVEVKIKRSEFFKSRAIICEECKHGPMCVTCTLKAHEHAPLHILKTFNGYFWEKITLYSIGHTVQIGHTTGKCSHPTEAKALTVIDTRGIQRVKVQFCNCAFNLGLSQEHRYQLLRYGWFPATVRQPETVATFSVLRLYETISFQGKVSAHDFYQTLVNVTDNTGLKVSKSRYKEFLRMGRQYKHLMMLKRKGVALLDGKTKAIKPGDLAQPCPACPHPGINLPEDWRTREEAWIYCLFLMIDANFRLKLKAKGIKDVELGSGWSYFVETTAYESHVAAHVNEDEMRYCSSGLKAVDHAHLRGNQDYDVTGIVGIQCRHMLMRKNGVGDLQKGERQGNVDFILLSTLIAIGLVQLVISYDIACQYSVNFKKRMEKYPAEMQLPLSAIILLFVIPKFHLPGHGEKCQSKFSLNFRKHMARTDGENIERGWAHLNGLSMATKEMGPGSRRDTVSEHIQRFNFKGVVNFGKTFTRKLKEAVKETEKHSKALDEFNESFTEEIRLELQNKMDTWEEDVENNEDPFREERVTVKTSDVKRELLLQEAKDSKKGYLRAGRLTATHWLTVGMELEDLQASLKAAYTSMKETKTSLRKDTTDDKSVMVYYKIKIWMEMQRRFMPGLVNTSLASSDDSEGTYMEEMDETEILDDEHVRDVWKIKLIMPSSLSSEIREKVCVDGLAEKERKLREAQAYDILEEARAALRKGFIFVNQKIKHVAGSGQERNSRMNQAISDVRVSGQALKDRYNHVRDALNSLDPDGDWKASLNELKTEDLVKPGLEEGGDSEGRRKAGWIWTMRGAGMTSEQGRTQDTRSEMHGVEADESDKAAEGSAEAKEFDKGLAVEWARARARAERWKEEVILLKEEMRRVLEFLSYEASRWIAEGERYGGDKSDLSIAYVAYANKQATTTRMLGRSFRELWNSTGLVHLDVDVGIRLNGTMHDGIVVFEEPADMATLIITEIE